MSQVSRSFIYLSDRERNVMSAETCTWVPRCCQVNCTEPWLPLDDDDFQQVSIAGWQRPPRWCSLDVGCIFAYHMASVPTIWPVSLPTIWHACGSQLRTYVMDIATVVASPDPHLDWHPGWYPPDVTDSTVACPPALDRQCCPWSSVLLT